MSVKVSVIVPVYNAEKTLARCLGNLVHQTLSEIELILINDASTDGSLKILLECEHAFSNKVIVVNMDHNSGPGGARNAGLAYASGEYIGFVDSDDIPDTCMYERLYKSAVSGDYDMVDGAYYYEETDEIILLTADDTVGTLDEKKRSKLIAGGGYLCTRIFRRELFSNLFFRENIILEDMEVLMVLFMRAKKITTVKELVYKYSATPASASKVSNPVAYHKAVTEAMCSVANSMMPLEGYEGVQTAVEYALLHLYKCGIVNAMQPGSGLNPIVRKSYLHELREIRMRYVRVPYNMNEYVKNKIVGDDLHIMEMNDNEELNVH